jgi:nucleoside-diphosphate-sugar epimerase
MKRVLITGARGFIGRHCVPLLQGAGLEVHAATSREPPVEDEGVIWHRADLRQPAEVARLVDESQPQSVLHLAWDTTPGMYWATPENVRWVEGSLVLLREAAARGATRFVGAGTCAEYEWRTEPLREDDVGRRPSTLYGVCKRALGDTAAAFCVGHTSMTFAWGRVFFVHGPGEPEVRLIPSVVRSLLDGRPAECTSGEQVRDFLAVEDVAGAFVRLLRSEVEGPVNIGSGTGVRLKDVVKQIGVLIGRPELIHLGAKPMRADEPFSIVADAGRLTHEVGWTPRHDLRSGLETSIDWWGGGHAFRGGVDWWKAER